MKLYNKLFALSAVSLMAISCTDLDKFPEGSVMTEEQKADVIKGAPEKLAADVNGLSAAMQKVGTLDGGLQHYDFGYPSVAMMLESSGQDFIGPDAGYNWYRSSMNFSDRLYTSSPTLFFWKFFYNHIKTANDVLAMIDPAATDPTLQLYRGQALASRAFDYLHLVQIFQFTYAGHESALAVPLVVENMPLEQTSNNPRATVKEVYDKIIADLTDAITLLEGKTVSAKDQINQAVAYGLRARANLLMQNWAGAAQDADAALAASGATPYTLEQMAAAPAFYKVDQNWMWASIISPDNDVVQTGIVNYPSMMCSLTGNGYTTLVGQYRSINKNLYDMIPESDVRKGWWLNAEATSPIVPAEVVKEFGITPYANVKFHAEGGSWGNPTNAQDWVIMRAEEMILIKAEAQAMGGNIAAGKTTLEDFVKTFRDPKYSCTASSATAFQDEIWKQRRIELWGEGFGFLDLLRLKKPVVRKGVNFPIGVQYQDIAAESQILIYRIPLSEIEVNNGISEADNNPVAPTPSV